MSKVQGRPPLMLAVGICAAIAWITAFLVGPSVVADNEAGWIFANCATAMCLAGMLYGYFAAKIWKSKAVLKTALPVIAIVVMVAMTRWLAWKLMVAFTYYIVVGVVAGFLRARSSINASNN